MFKKVLLLIAFICLCVNGVAQVKIKPLQKNEKVVFLGDSITNSGRYITYIQLFYALRHPGSNIIFMNGGIAGEQAKDGISRLDSDIMPKNPDRIFIMFGMNDVGRFYYKDNKPNDYVVKARKKRLDDYEKNQKLLADKILNAGKKVVFMTPSPYDQYGELKSRNYSTCNEPGLKNCAEIVRKVAAENQLPCVELYKPMTEQLKKHPGMHLCGPDRVHPWANGHLLMAALILDAIGVDNTVASVIINADTKKTTCQNAKIEDLKISSDKVSFKYIPKALPFPTKIKEYSKVEFIYPLTQKLNNETLEVSALSPGHYTVKANGQNIGQFSNKQLAVGINLAKLNTPSAAKAAEAVKLAEKISGLESRLRYLIFTEKIIKRAKINLQDFNASIACLDKFLEKRKKSSFWRKIVRDYKADKPHEKELQAQVQEYRKKLCSIRPAPVQMEISKVDANR